MKRSRVEVDPVLRTNRLAFTRQRARHALQRFVLDCEYFAARAAVEECAHVKEAAARDRALASAPSASPSTAAERAPEPAKPADTKPARGSKAASAAAAQLAAARTAEKVAESAAEERATAATHAALQALTTRASRTRALVARQTRERARLGRELRRQLGDVDADAGDEDAGGDTLAAAATPGGKASSGGGAGGAAAGGKQPVYLCAYCGIKVDRLKLYNCSECHRDFCGVGGRQLIAPHGLPCCEIYKCGCGTNLCYECYMGGASRASTLWRRCSFCSAMMCVKESEGRSNLCRFCGVGPICRQCRNTHTDCGAREGEDEDEDEAAGSGSDEE